MYSIIRFLLFLFNPETAHHIAMKSLKVADFFVQDSQKSFLNAILDKVSKVSRFKGE